MTFFPFYAGTGTFSGISPDSKDAIGQGETMEQEKKLAREALISAYEKNISTRVKAELRTMDVNSYTISKGASKQTLPLFLLSSLESNHLRRVIQHLYVDSKCSEQNVTNRA